MTTNPHDDYQLDDLRAEYAETGGVTSGGAVWLIGQVVVLREQVQRLTASSAVAQSAETALRDRIAALAEDLRYVLGYRSPRHAHERPGVWDTSGKPCEHCARLAAARENLAAYDADPSPPAAASAVSSVGQAAHTTRSADLLRRTEAYLSALHGSVARHDNLGVNLGCAGCELRDEIRNGLAAVDWTDGHPQLEAIASAVWEQCGRSDNGSCVEDDPRNIAVAALAAVLPPPADSAAEEAYRLALSTALGLGTAANWEAIRDRAEDLTAEVQGLTEAHVRQMEAAASDGRAAVLNETADHLARQAADASPSARDVILADAAELRRLADETQQSAGVCVHPDGYDGECPCPPSCSCCTVTATRQPEETMHQQRVTRARHEGAMEALRSAAEHMDVGAAIGPVPYEVRPVIVSWLRRLAEQRLDRARKEALRQVADDAQPTVVPAGAGEEPADETQTLAAMFEGLHTLLATSSRDWGTYRVDAWLWAVLCGWDCEQAVHDETCMHGTLEEMQQQHGWNDEAVAKARRYRAVVRAIEDRAAASQPGKEH